MLIIYDLKNYKVMYIKLFYIVVMMLNIINLDNLKIYKK